MVDMQCNGYLVGIRCYTYNHAPYIEDALNGFTMQQTNFPFIAMIVDDASTDGEQEVISSYVEKYFDIGDQNVAYKEETDYAYITFAQHKTNRNCFIVVLYLKENHYQKRKGRKKLEYLSQWRDKIKYEALCEGDDYWIDPLKLQKQVDFMQKHPKHSLCFHAHSVEYEGKIEPHHFYLENATYCRVEDLILADGDGMATNSMLYRKDLCTDVPKWTVGLSFGDFSLELTLAERGFVGYMNENMSCYRLSTSGSWSNSINKNIKKQIKNRKERLKMWLEYNKWTHNKYIKTVLRMFLLDFCRLLGLRYMSIFNLQESKLYSAARWIYRKLK